MSENCSEICELQAAETASHLQGVYAAWLADGYGRPTGVFPDLIKRVGTAGQPDRGTRSQTVHAGDLCQISTRKLKSSKYFLWP